MVGGNKVGRGRDKRIESGDTFMPSDLGRGKINILILESEQFFFFFFTFRTFFIYI